MQPHRPRYRSSIARTQEDVDRIQQLRFRSIGSDLNIRIAHDPRVGRDLSAFDNLGTSHNLLLHCGRTLVGTARLALPNPEVARASGTDLGFEIEEEIDLGGLRGIHEHTAEIGRVCVLRPFQSTHAVIRLYEALYCLSRELGVSHWIGGADCRTSRADEAELMFTALERRGLVHRRFHVGVRSPHRGEAGEDAPGESFYSEPERQRASAGVGEMPISSTLTAFARRLGARVIGPPVRHPAFPRFVLPMLVALDEFPQETLKKFDLSLLGPSVAAEPLAASSPAPDHVAPGERMAS